jgi:hypothetical protein
VDPLRYTLVGDGSSDRCLLPILNWLLTEISSISERGFISQAADLRGEEAPASDLPERIRRAYQQWPCDLLFIHRDAERMPLEKRIDEILVAASAIGLAHVPVVPVRMTEAWLLIDENAIRRAADNPNGASELPIPALRRLEHETAPKALLHSCLIAASEKTGRRLDQFRRSLPRRAHRVADFISDFSPLRELAAFARFEATTREVVASLRG